MTKIAAYDAAVAALPTFDPEILRTSAIKVEELSLKIKGLVELQAAWSAYEIYFQKVVEHETSIAESQKETMQEEKIVEFLLDLQGLIKSNLVPKINEVASTWLQRITAGKHTSVELTQDMEVLVDGDMVEGLSGSGKAVAHLSLRMALGQVLTNGVFPVFVTDEIDSSMDEERSALVVENLLKMLNGSLKQLVMISHKNVEGATNEILL